jgi:glycosyltransferase involved in cell wall biosynthesis
MMSHEPIQDVRGPAAPIRVVVLANTTWFLFNFRLNLIRALRDAGYEVIAISPADGYESRLTADGIRHLHWPVDATSVNPLAELRCLRALHGLLKAAGPLVLLSYTPKGNIYGALAAALRGISVVPSVEGLGRVFIRQGGLSWLVQRLYKLAFSQAPRVFFLNNDDIEFFLDRQLVAPEKAERLHGFGVDVDRFKPAAIQLPPDAARPLVFLMTARLLWDKGVGEFVAAARQIRQRHPEVRFQLLGFVVRQDPGAVTMAAIEAWLAEGVIEYLGATDDVLPYLQAVDCVVLPSYYREGMPRVLLEAASVAKPVIAADSTGCRDALINGVSGLLCKPRDAADLAEKMLQMIRMSTASRQEMGRQGRQLMLARFDERQVLERYLAVVKQVTTSADMPRAEAVSGGFLATEPRRGLEP